MKKTALSLRLDPPQLERLQELATRYKVTDANIIRWALDALSDYVAQHRGHCMLPIDFTTLWHLVEKHQPLNYRDALKHDISALNEDPVMMDVPVSKAAIKAAAAAKKRKT